MNSLVEHKEKARPPIMESRVDEIEFICKKVFDTTPSRVALPGGKSRPVFIVDINGDPYVLVKRSNKYDAKVEAAVLQALSPSQTVPQFIHRHGRWIVQEFVQGVRLPVLIDEEPEMSERTVHISRALDSLVDIQHLALEARLQRRAPRLGVTNGWIDNRISAMDDISKLTMTESVTLDRQSIKKIYDVKQSDFIKWDARPGNAMIRRDQICWFDWEDCGRRNRIDDLVCFMSDEWTNVSADVESELIETYLPKFSRDLPDEWSRNYFYVAGCLQLLYRLRLAMEFYDRDQKWWDRAYCLKGDKVGVTPQEVKRLCERLGRWSKRHDSLAPFGPWSQNVRKALGLQ